MPWRIRPHRPPKPIGWTHATTANQRGYDYAHQLARATVLRNNPWCAMCGRARATELDHIVPLSRGGSRLNPSNLRGVCSACHKKKTAKDRNAK